MNSGWFVTLRSILELVYFVSAVVLTAVAFYGLKQLRLTKQIAAKNAKRESIKFATERCQYFAETVIPLQDAAANVYRQNKLTCLNNQRFKVEKGEIVQHNFDPQRMALSEREFSVVGANIVSFLNSLEAFAIPFVAGVADDELGFQETASSFCKGLSEVMLMIVVMRGRGPRYESAVKLYECWGARLEAQKLRPLVQSMSEKINAAEKAKFPPLESS
ncbi:MAG: hypothetical protein LAO23_09115 [Acidobacteriia bacterium]|nr:hypothetical protein [Terriglobia bacterium]